MQMKTAKSTMAVCNLKESHDSIIKEFQPECNNYLTFMIILYQSFIRQHFYQ